MCKNAGSQPVRGWCRGFGQYSGSAPFDNKESGFNSVVNLQGIYTDINDKISPKLSAMGSWTNDTIGVLGGISIYNKN